MGMFDRVWFPCPTTGCDATIEAQSKAGECCLADYDYTEVPMVIAADINGQSVYCQKCKNFSTIQGTIASFVHMQLISGDGAGNCRHCGK